MNKKTRNEWRWHKNHVLKLCSLPIIQLLEETLNLAGGDDYDGYFTDLGFREYYLLKYILIRRIRKFRK